MVSLDWVPKCLDTSRDMLFVIAATREKKAQLAAKEAELEATETDEDRERITIEIQQLKDEEIERATLSGEMEKKELNKQQAKNVGKLAFNIGLAIKKDRDAVNNARKIQGDGKKAVDGAKKSKIKAAKGATKVQALSHALTHDIPEILAEAPRQVKTLEAFMSATKALRKTNEIEDLGEPKDDDEFQEIEF